MSESTGAPSMLRQIRKAVCGLGGDVADLRFELVEESSPGT